MTRGGDDSNSKNTQARIYILPISEAGVIEDGIVNMSVTGYHSMDHTAI